MVIVGQYLIFPVVQMPEDCDTFDTSFDRYPEDDWQFVYIESEAGIQEIWQTYAARRTWR